MTRTVRTVRGDIDAALLGPTDAHDHAFFASPAAPGEEFLDLRLAVDEVATLARAGAAAFVDWTPPGLGRDLAGLRVVSEATGMHIVAATGVHRDVHYAVDDPVRARGVDQLADSFVSELTADGVPCGVVKVGASYHRLLPLEEAAFAAAGAAHARTGAPVCVHTERGTMGLAIVERLTAAGVPASSIVLAHVDRNPDPGEHAETASAGAWLELDGPGRTKYWPDSTILGLIADLAERGHAGRILLGGDAGGRSMLRAYGGGPGMDYLFARFKPRLERELGSELAQQIFVANPAQAFALSRPAA